MTPPATMHDQTVLLFAGAGGVLVFASLVGFLLKWRAGFDKPNATIDNLNARVKSWWLMIAVIGAAVWSGRAGVIALFAFASFLALREFITIAPTRRGDHKALLLSFAVVLPLQYFFVWIEWYGMYAIFIPVYAFLFLPIVAALSSDTSNFLERAAVTQWGLMISVYCISLVPALLTLRIPGYEDRNLLLVIFLILVVQSSDVLQYVWASCSGGARSHPSSRHPSTRGFCRRHAVGIGSGCRPVVDNPVRARASLSGGARHHDDGLSGRAGDVGNQARSRHKGLGLADRGPRWHAGPSRFSVFLGAGVLSHRPLLVDPVGRCLRNAGESHRDVPVPLA